MRQTWLTLARLTRCALLLAGLGFAWASVAGDRGPVIPKGQGEHCVAETDFMRRNHMDLIMHQRDETVIRGLRDEPFSLVECVDCHARVDNEGKPVRIDAKGEFCSSCHEFVAAKIDCFSCHAAMPDEQREDTALIDKDDVHGLLEESLAHMDAVTDDVFLSRFFSDFLVDFHVIRGAKHYEDSRSD